MGACAKESGVSDDAKLRELQARADAVYEALAAAQDALSDCHNRWVAARQAYHAAADAQDMPLANVRLDEFRAIVDELAQKQAVFDAGLKAADVAQKAVLDAQPLEMRELYMKISLEAYRKRGITPPDDGNKGPH